MKTPNYIQVSISPKSFQSNSIQKHSSKEVDKKVYIYHSLTHTHNTTKIYQNSVISYNGRETHKLSRRKSVL